MEEEVRAAVFGNVGTMIVFRVGAFDAEVLEKEFMPQFTAEDLVNLGIFQTYLKLMIDGISSQPFSATTLPPIAKPESSSMQAVIEMSRKQFAHPRAEVEKRIDDWMAPIKAPQKDKAPAGMGNSTNGSGGPSNGGRNPLQVPVVSRPVVSATPNVPSSATIATNNTPITSVSAPTPSIKPEPIPTINPNKSIPPIVPPIDQPFKKAFQEIKVEEKILEKKVLPVNPPIQTPIQTVQQPPIKSVQLDSLQIKNKPKDAQPQRVNELKNALASLLGSQKPQASVEKNVEKIEEKKEQQEKIEPKPQIHKHTSHHHHTASDTSYVKKHPQESLPTQAEVLEVSEEKLKEILKVD